MQDPVCGMTVDPHKAAGMEVYNGVTYAFCSPHCLAKFRADPAQYVAPSHETHGDAPGAGTVYTHLRQDKLYIKENKGILHEVKISPAAYRRDVPCSCP
jgi:YHS domain-containing protein